MTHPSVTLGLIDWLVYGFMFLACILISTVAMLIGISGTAILTPALILAFPILGVQIIQMMENAGTNLARLARRLLDGFVQGKLVAVAAGKGKSCSWGRVW